MKLHLNADDFKTLVTLSSQTLGIPEVFIEKDYWVTFVLKNLSLSDYKNEVIFKGGTSLSKAHKIIKRFSEDIDLAYLAEVGGEKKRYQEKFSKIDKSITLGPLKEIKTDDTSKGPRLFRKTVHEYPRFIDKNDFGDASDKLLLEINAYTTPKPSNLISIESYIAETLRITDQATYLDEYGLREFEINVLDKERTFAEKICGIAKATNKENDDLDFFRRKIRHLYDISKLMDDNDIKDFIKKDEFLVLVQKIREEDKAIFEGEAWTSKKFNEALIFNDTENTLRKVQGAFVGNFQQLLYTGEVVPKLDIIGEQISKIYERIKELDK